MDAETTTWLAQNWFWVKWLLTALLPLLTAAVGALFGKKAADGFEEGGTGLMGVLEAARKQTVQNNAIIGGVHDTGEPTELAIAAETLIDSYKRRCREMSPLAQGAVDVMNRTVDEKKEQEPVGRRALRFVGRAAFAGLRARLGLASRKGE